MAVAPRGTAASVDRARNLCRRVRRALEEWEDARSGQGSVGAVQGLVNAAIATGYLKAGPFDGDTAGARWVSGEEQLRAQLEGTLWEQRVQSQQTLADRLRRMDTAVAELRKSVGALQGEDKNDDNAAAGFQAIDAAYLRELLSEATAALAEETALCHRLAADAAALSGQEREQHLLLSSAWTARPCVSETRLRSLRDAVGLELAAS